MPPRLLESVRHALRLRHYSPRTEAAYVAWVRRFVRWSGLRHPRELGEREVERFLTALAVDGRVAPSTQNQALAALQFLYRDVLGTPLALPEHAVRAKTRPHIPVVLTRGEVWAVIDALHRTPSGRTPALVATLLYGAGLRLAEALALRVLDTAPGLYDWQAPGRPEDLSFYAPDGRLLFASIAHERDAWFAEDAVSLASVRGALPGLRVRAGRAADVGPEA